MIRKLSSYFEKIESEVRICGYFGHGNRPKYDNLCDSDQTLRAYISAPLRPRGSCGKEKMILETRAFSWYALEKTRFEGLDSRARGVKVTFEGKP